MAPKTRGAASSCNAASQPKSKSEPDSPNAGPSNTSSHSESPPPPSAPSALPRALPTPPEHEPGTYKPTRSERFVFNTPPYSGYIKRFWRFKDEQAAKESCEAIWGIFLGYVDVGDFVGMDTCRKFIQMGRTRSTRYALRPGGKKYTKDPQTGERVEMQRDGTVYDRGKLEGAKVFGGYEGRCWREGGYRDMWAAYGGKPVDVSALALTPGPVPVSKGNDEIGGKEGVGIKRKVSERDERDGRKRRHRRASTSEDELKKEDEDEDEDNDVGGSGGGSTSGNLTIKEEGRDSASDAAIDPNIKSEGPASPLRETKAEPGDPDEQIEPEQVEPKRAEQNQARKPRKARNGQKRARDGSADGADGRGRDAGDHTVHERHPAAAGGSEPSKRARTAAKG